MGYYELWSHEEGECQYGVSFQVYFWSPVMLVQSHWWNQERLFGLL